MEVETVADDDPVDAGEDACIGRLFMALSFGEADDGNEWAEREEWASNFEDKDSEE